MTTKAQVIEMTNRGEGCLGKASPDEPVFVLRAQDKFAPDLIERWADKVDAARGTQIDKSRKARALAHQMRAWQALHDAKTPD